MKSLYVSLFMFLLCVPLAHSTIYQCPDGTGKFYYSNIPCASSSAVIKSDNAPKSLPARQKPAKNITEEGDGYNYYRDACEIQKKLRIFAESYVDYNNIDEKNGYYDKYLKYSVNAIDMFERFRNISNPSDVMLLTQSESDLYNLLNNMTDFHTKILERTRRVSANRKWRRTFESGLYCNVAANHVLSNAIIREQKLVVPVVDIDTDLCFRSIY